VNHSAGSEVQAKRSVDAKLNMFTAATREKGRSEWPSDFKDPPVVAEKHYD
jgi:hypothetical protein